MLVSMIILGVLALMIIVGLGRPILKDLRVHWIAALVFFAAVIGLNFIPLISIGNFTFSVGTALFYLVILGLFFVKSKFSTAITAFAGALIFGGLIYAATRVSLLTGNEFFGTTNWVYALVMGFIAFILARNGKYSFLMAAEAMMLANFLVQIGSGEFSLNYGFDWAVVAAGTAFTFHAITVLILTHLPGDKRGKNKFAEMFESGRLKD